MSDRVVDTNVAIVANGRDTHASIACRVACVQALTALQNRGRVVVDDEGKILSEYAKRLHPEGQPGVGDLFYRHVLDNQGNRRSVLSVNTNSDRAQPLKSAFVAGNLARFHDDDRVFALTAAVARVPVATALDSDWPNHEVGLRACGVNIDYVCGRAAAEHGGVN